MNVRTSKSNAGFTRLLLVVCGAASMSLGVFLVLPVLQAIGKPPKPDLQLTNADVVNQPPPPVVEDEPEQEEEVDEQPPRGRGVPAVPQRGVDALERFVHRGVGETHDRLADEAAFVEIDLDLARAGVDAPQEAGFDAGDHAESIPNFRGFGRNLIGVSRRRGPG